MQIIGYILWVIGLLWAIAQGINNRQMAKNKQATERVFEVHAMLLAVSVIVIPVLSLSPFNLLWMMPASFVLGLASVMLPLSLLGIPASLYSLLWYIGISSPGRALYLAEKYDEAIEAFKETLQKKPNSAETHFYIGLTYSKVGDIDNAIESYKTAIMLKPNAAEVHCNLGFEYRDLGKVVEAADSFKAAISIRSNYAKAIWNLGMIYIELHDLDNALKQHKALQTLDRENADKLHSAIASAH